VARYVWIVSSLQKSDHVVVVGAGLAGWRFVEALRREGFTGELTLIGEEVHPPYDRPPLSKQILSGKWELEKAILAKPEQLEAANVQLMLGIQAVGIDVSSHSVQLSDGSAVQGTHLVIATGTRARPLAFDSSGSLPTLRNHEDVAEFSETIDRLGEGDVVVIIGGGFVGAEVATSIKGRGHIPLVLEVAQRPLQSVVGNEVSLWLQSLSSDFGIEVRTNQHIVDVSSTSPGYVVTFDDGSSLEAGAVFAAVGSALDLDWLAQSGLTIDNGIVVDRDLQAAPGVGAIGDVARFTWIGPAGEELSRMEHWQVAIDHALHLAHFWMTGESLPPMIPYFWSDQYGKKIQMLGNPRASDEVTMVSGAIDEGKWTALYSRAGIVTGVVALSQPRALMLSKVLLEETTTLEHALVRTPWSS
jgi:NADPH-dependent 2,4-dienoyl-CoA reductase/sulfur reductase-like enzyme